MNSQPSDQLSTSGHIIPSGTWKKFPVLQTPDRQRFRPGVPVTSSCSRRKPLTPLQHTLGRTQQNRADLINVPHHVNRNGPKPLQFPVTVSKIRVAQPHRAHKADDSFYTTAKRRLADYSFDANQSVPLLSHKLNTSLRHELGLITPPARHKLQRGYAVMDTIRVDGANGLRFSARRKVAGGAGSGYFTPGTGSPYGGNSDKSAYNAAVVSAATSDSPFLRAANTSSAAHSLAAADASAGGHTSIVTGAPPAAINPHKAVFTLDSRTSRILIVNHNACLLLGYTSRELCDMLFADLLTASRSQPTNANRSHVSALAEGQLNSVDGTMVLLSGKVVEMNTKQAPGRVAVSLWIRQIDAEGVCLAVAEPVERRVAQLHIDRNGAILSGDAEALLLFQLDSAEMFAGMDVQQLIPAIVLPDADSSQIAKHVRKQKATGRTADGVTFPLCLILAQQPEATAAAAASVSVVSVSTVESGDSGVSNNAGVFVLTVYVFQNFSGLVVMDERGVIESVNHHFSILMFGYAQMKILGRHITDVIPNFGADMEYVPAAVEAVRSRNGTGSSIEGEEDDDAVDVGRTDDDDDDGHGADGYESDETETDPVYYENEAFVMSEGRADVPRLSTTTSTSTVYVQTGDEMLVKTRSEPVNIARELSRADDRDTPICRRAMCHERTGGHSLDNSYHSSAISALHDVQRTPVNEMSVGATFGRAAVTPVAAIQPHRTYQLSDISEALRAVETSVADANGTRDSITAGHGMDSPKFNPQQTEAGNLRLKQMTSTPAPDLRRPSSALATATIATGSSALRASAMLAESCTDDISTASTPAHNTATAATPTAAPPSRGCYDHTDTGKYRGVAVHYDGNVFDIVYSVSRQTLPCGRRCFCVWICRDPDQEYDDDRLGGSRLGDGLGADDDENRLQNLSLTFNSITSTVENSLGQAIKHTAAQNNSRPASVSLMSQCEEDQCNGEFHKNYTTLRQIGKGAYGYVKLAYRQTDRLLVVTKFIRKDKLTPQTMIQTEDKRPIPMEIYLLTTVKHPNIVTVYDVYENERFFQMVMEKHGAGMDLFEFIDRQPLMDERLGCYIFRQIVDAVDYLHSLNILHRDIKDENIIIDQNFHVKLIDFGSATFMEEGKLFSTFYGTTEYCSPEVLAGNKYAGPELEMWSLGVTLYVLLVFENPFLDIEETLRAELSVPAGLSRPLELLLRSMLHKEPLARCTMRQLKANAWLQQEIAPGTFSFGWVVPCDAQEANPEQYFSGPVYSSATALSTMSAHDSLSLVDDDVGVDGLDGAGDDDEEDDEEDDDDAEDSIVDVESEEMLRDDEVVLAATASSSRAGNVDDDDDEDEDSQLSQDDMICLKCDVRDATRQRPPTPPPPPTQLQGDTTADTEKSLNVERRPADYEEDDDASDDEPAQTKDVAL